MESNEHKFTLDPFFNRKENDLIDSSLLLDTTMAQAKQNSTGWENLTCYCKNQKDIPYKPFGYLTTIKNNVKYVTFLRKCSECGKLRGNFEESKPKEEGISL